jgi:hypothetical protein
MASGNLTTETTTFMSEFSASSAEPQAAPADASAEEIALRGFDAGALVFALGMIAVLRSRAWVFLRFASMRCEVRLRKAPMLPIKQKTSNWSRAAFLTLALGMTAAGAQATPLVQDISPNTPNNTIEAYANTAGRIYALGGDYSVLYAISQNAGVWRSVLVNGNRATWEQLPNSPRLAASIAIDPNDPFHLAVGERTGSAADHMLDRTGVWESRDGGSNWSLTFNPLTIDDCKTRSFQSIPSVAFSSQSTLVIAAPCGIVRKSATGKVDFTPEAEPVTAIAASHTKLWARSAHGLYFSNTDGVSWQSFAIPGNLNALGNGDMFSLAAVDFEAFMVAGTPTPDKKTDFSELIEFNLNSGFHVQRVHCSGDDLRDGTGLAGQRFVKAFELVKPDLPERVGSRLQLFFSEGQTICRATGLDSLGRVTGWERIASSTEGIEPNDRIHPDWWDYLLSSDGNTAWIATDGGIYAKGPSTSGTWVTQNDGLHTQHVHTLTVLPTSVGPRLAYATHDNSEWFRDNLPLAPPFSGWITWHRLGDASWTAGDAGSPQLALIVRHAADSVLTDFGLAPPVGAKHTSNDPFTPYCLKSVDPQTKAESCADFPSTFGPQGLVVIQSPVGSLPHPLLDTVMLVSLPLQSLQNGKVESVSGPLSKVTSMTKGPVLIRNGAFASNPDANESQYSGWTLESDTVPWGITRIWVSNGHFKPAYYAYAKDAAGNVSLYSQVERTQAWKDLGPAMNSSGIASGVPNVDGSLFGPIYVNPWDPAHLFVLTNAVVKVSTSGGSDFRDDPVLTALITESGKYSLGGTFSGQNDDGMSSATASSGLALLSSVAFNRERPHEVVVSSPFTGVLYAADENRLWRSLTAYLPQPLPPVSSVSIDKDTIYVSTEGRGVFRIDSFSDAPLATYFKRATSGSATGHIAQLLRSDGAPVVNAPVELTILDVNQELHFVTSTDSNGWIPMTTVKPTWVIHFAFAGNNEEAPARASFKY